MQAFVTRRLLALLPTLIFASLIVFVSMRLIPGDVIDLMLAQNDLSTDHDRAAIEAALGWRATPAARGSMTRCPMGR
ncbi:MAG: hypothetical protein OXH37_02340, partial [Gammaproteobacteria bacterium]|nr:hypothetical protein [Gammaproteobacteria bacterium]